MSGKWYKSHTHTKGTKNECRSRYHSMESTCQQRSSNSCNEKMFCTTAFLNTTSIIAAGSSNFVSAAAAADDLSNDQDSVEVYYSKTKKNERSSVQDPITKCYDCNYTQKSITEDKADLVLLEIQSQ